MELENRFLPGCVVVDVIDEQLGHPKTMLLKNHVIRLLEDGHRHIILNLARLEMLDSFGLAVLISLLKMCRERTGSLSLCNLSQSVTQLITLTRIENVLDVYPSEKMAIKGLKT